MVESLKSKDTLGSFSSIQGKCSKAISGGKFKLGRKRVFRQKKLVFESGASLLASSTANRKRGVGQDKGSANMKRMKMDLNFDDPGDS